MTLDRIRELLKEADTAKPGYIDAAWDTDLLDAALPLLRRWTDQTPVTPEALEREGWQEYQYTGHPCVAWRYRKQVDAERCLRCAMASGGDAPGISCWYTGGFDETAQIAEVRTMGQLNMIVDAIQGVK